MIDRRSTIVGDPLPEPREWLPAFERDQEIRRALRAPFAPERIGRLPRTAKRPELDFVGHAAVTDRLNHVAPGWTYTLDSVDAVNGRCWIRGTIWIGGVSRVEFGDGADPKEAIGNFIRRGAMRFGVALDLWSRQELDGYEDSAETTAAAGFGPDPSQAASSATYESASADGREPLLAPEPDVGDRGVPAASGAEGRPGGSFSEEVPGGDADPSAVRPLRDRPDWAAIARELGTTATDAKVKILRFLRSADVNVRQASEINSDLADWAVRSMMLGRSGEPAKR